MDKYVITSEGVKYPIFMMWEDDNTKVKATFSSDLDRAMKFETKEEALAFIIKWNLSPPWKVGQVTEQGIILV